MRTIIIFFFFAYISNQLFSQLRLTSTGDIGIGTSAPGARLEVRKNDALTEARVYSYSGANTYDARLWTMNNIASYGIGVSGSSGHIFGNVNSPNKLITFDGSGKVAIGQSFVNSTFKFYVNGNSGGLSAWNGSDLRLKKDISNLEGCLSKLQKINGKHYKYLKEELNFRSIDNKDSESFGFIAQEIKGIFPELVMISEDSMKTHYLNYDGFIPVIVEAIKEQQHIIEDLKNEIEDLKNLKNIQVSNINSNIKLLQNIPNPFNESTRIEFKLNNNVQNARICIYDLTGKELKCYIIKDNTESFISIKGKELKPGMYFYSLIIDNEIYDTKRMVVLTQL